MYIKHKGTLHNLSYYREIYKPKHGPESIALETKDEIKYLGFKDEQERDNAFEKINRLTAFTTGLRLKG